MLGVTESRICQMHTKAVLQLRGKLAEGRRLSVVRGHMPVIAERGPITITGCRRRVEPAQHLTHVGPRHGHAPGGRAHSVHVQEDAAAPTGVGRLRGESLPSRAVHPGGQVEVDHGRVAVLPAV